MPETKEIPKEKQPTNLKLAFLAQNGHRDLGEE